MAILVARKIYLRQLQVPRIGKFDRISTYLFMKYLQISGVLSILHLHRPDQRHDLLPLHPGPLALLRGEHLRLGPVRLAHG